MGAGITGIGTSLPEKIITNADLEKLVDTSDEWIRSRTGIRERRVVSDGENASDLAVKSAEKALQAARVRKKDVDLVLVATASPEMIFPSTSCRVAHKLGIKNIPAFDISAACTGFVYGLAVGAQFVNAGTYKTVLFIGTDVLSRFVDWSDRSTCILFGDAAGAVVLQQVEEGYGVLASFLSSDGAGSDLLKIPAGGSLMPGNEDSVRNKMHSIKMNGNEIFKFAIGATEEAARKVLKIAGITMDDVDFVIPHQANQRITEAAGSRLKIDPSRMVSNIEKYGNTSTASIPLALEDIWSERKLQKGQVVMFIGFGAGLTWGANLVRWSMKS